MAQPPPYNPQFSPQQGYPAQQGYPPPQGNTTQGYPPPHQGYPPQQQGYPPQQAAYTTHQTNVVVQPARTSQLGTSLGSLFKSAEKAVVSAGKTVQHEADRYANSPTIMMFNHGNVVRLQSRETSRFLQVLNTGVLGANAAPQDPSAHFTVLNCGHNNIILRSVIYPTCHIANHGGNIVGNGNGDLSCRFRLHETVGGFVTFESITPRDHHIGVTAEGAIKPAHLARKDNSAMFCPSLVSTAQPQPMYVQQTTTTTYKAK
ncbi:uncharacterized protein LOC119735582 [Patiria miniata]|uniref:Uncharacterized protein n=1 Tax=Patiria miniata TaxID=46514 RepID=A0A914ANE7_PATMI|nr:uncharacterized protein LOC119735582 [Patiria miniata]